MHQALPLIVKESPASAGFPTLRSLPVRVLKLLAVRAICRARWSDLMQGWRESLRKLRDIKVSAGRGGVGYVSEDVWIH